MGPRASFSLVQRSFCRGMPGMAFRGGERRRRGENEKGRVPSDVKESERVSGVAQDSGTLFKLRRVETSITVVPPQLSPRGQTQATYPSPSNLFFLSAGTPSVSLTFISYLLFWARRQDSFPPDCYTLKICFIRIARFLEFYYGKSLRISINSPDCLLSVLRFGLPPCTFIYFRTNYNHL